MRIHVRILKMLDKDKDFDLAHLGEIALMQGMAAAG